MEKMEKIKKMKMKMEVEQLVNMGFNTELAAKALAATGGDSLLKATDWILTHQNPSPNPCPNPNANPSPPPSQQQPKLNRFFHSTSPSPSHTAPDAEPSIMDRKRPKLVHSATPSHKPLYERMRPRAINDVIGQDHLLSNEENSKSLIRSAVECNRLPSVIFWGPPGSGKTSMAKAIANSVNSSYRFVSLSAVTAGVKDVRDTVDSARKIRDLTRTRTVLFVDEVHRFNKSQQDSFLPIIEDGSIVFMGATTENPSFHLVTPLLSRCRVLKLNPLEPHHIASLIKRAVNDLDNGLSQSLGMRVEVDDDAIEFLSTQSDGDARVALNVLEISATTATGRSSSDNNSDIPAGANEKKLPSVTIVTLEDAQEALQCKHIAYDKAGEEHYNLISALHKSMRGSDANASIYWLARMLEGGEEPLYIARRLVRFASEDVGLADPGALTIAVACYQACHFLGMPECNVNLAHCVAHLALASKSVSVYKALKAAQKAVRESAGQNEGVPLHLRNAPTKLMAELGYGKGYIYTPDNPFDTTQSYLPPSLQGYRFLDWPDDNAIDK